MASYSKLLKVTAAGSALLLGLAACNGDGTDDADTGDDTANGAASEQSTEGTGGEGPITFAMGRNDIDKLEPMIELWNEENPEQEVTLHELPGEADQQRDTLVQSLQAESGEYDVFALDITDTAYFAASGWIQPIEGEVEIDTSGLIDAAVETATYQDTLYAVPQNTNAQLLHYRTDLQPEAPANWQELVDSCGVIEENDEVNNCLDMQLSLYEGLTVQATQFIHSWGGTVVGEDGTTPTLDEPGAAEGLQALVDGYEDGTINPAADSFTEEETAQAFLSGETMYSYNWPYMYEAGNSDESSSIQGEFDVAPIVGPDGPGASTLGGYNNAINVFSENKATAAAFVEFIISEDVQMSFAEDSFPPVLESIYEDESLQEQFPYMETLREALDNAQPRPVTPFYPDVSKAIQDNTQAALNDGVPVEEALEQMRGAIEQAG